MSTATATLVAPRAIGLDRAAELAGLSRKTLDRQAKLGNLTTFRVGRRRLTTLQHLDAFLGRPGDGPDPEPVAVAAAD